MGGGARGRSDDSTLTVTTFGTVEVALDGSPVEIRSTKALALLVYLAETGRFHDRSSLAGLLWPDRTEGAARNNLRQALHLLRRLLPRHVVVVGDRIGIEGELEIDTREISSSTYGGEFVRGLAVADAELFDQWVVRTRARYQMLALARFAEEAEAHLDAGRISDGLVAATKLVDLEPWNETGQRLLMRLLHAGGRTAEAVEQYDRCVEALWQHIGVRPDAETEAVLAGLDRPDSPDRPPPPRATPVRVPATRLVGRDVEVRRLVAMLDDHETRLMSLVGPGGIGKTRLAMAVADVGGAGFDDGVTTATLEGIDDPGRVAPAVASAFGFVLTTDDQPEVALATMLSDRHHLLVVDNAEQVVDGVAGLCDAILRHAPRVWMLVTSRTRLDLAAECITWVEGLPTEAADGAPSPARQLFVERAGRVVADLEAADDAIDAVCRHVGGMPLAIELAARLAGQLPPATLLERLRSGGEVLVTTMRDVPVRHRSLASLLDEALDAIDSDLRDHLERCSVFRGGFDLGAAAAVARATSLSLDRLAARSLLSQRAGRYELHELIRQRAARRLAGNAPALVHAHDAHMVHHLAVLADEARPMVGPDGREVVERLEADFDNISQAWRRAVEQGRDDLIGRALPGLGHLVTASGRRLEGDRLIEQALATFDGVLHAELAAARLESAWPRTPIRTSADWYERAVAELTGDLSDRAAIAQARLNTWFALALGEYSGDLAAGFRLFDEAEALLADLDAPDERALLHLAWSKLRVEAAEHDGVEERLHAALAHFESVGDLHGQAEACNRLAQFNVENYRIGPAISIERRCLDLFTQLGIRLRRADVLLNHAGTHQLCGNWGETERLTRASVVEHAAAGESAQVPFALSQLAIARAGKGARAEAEQLFTRGVAGMREANYVLGLRLMLPEWGRFLLESGRHEQAVAVLQEAAELWRDVHNGHFLATIAAVESRALLALGHEQRAVLQAHEAWAVVRDAAGRGFPYPIRSIVDCMLVVGEADPDHETMLGLARALARDVLAAMPDPDLRRCFLELAEIRHIDITTA